MLLLDAPLTGAPAAQAAASAVQELSLWDLCLRGGPLMIPIALLSLVCVYIFVERAMVIHRASREDATFMRRIRDYVHEGELESAHNLCKKNGSPAVEDAGNIEVATLSKGLPWLATTAAGAPMLGFLGTVIGMVQAFYDIASAGNSANIATFSSGIYTALVTTVAGLVVGVIALFAYNYLVARVNSVMNLLEQKSMEFMDLLNEPA